MVLTRDAVSLDGRVASGENMISDLE